MERQLKEKDISRVGIISDTHGLLRPEAIQALNESDLIIHAGDIGRKEIIDQLSTIAPVIAVRGNMDSGHWAYRFRVTESVELHSTVIYVIHNLSALDLDPAVAQLHVVISGHSHKPSISTHKGVLYINPGSAGPQRFTLPVTVALLKINGTALDPKIVELR